MEVTCSRAAAGGGKTGVGLSCLTLARPFCANINDCLPSFPVSSAEGARVALEFHLFSSPLITYCAWADMVGDIAMTANTLVLVMMQGAILWVLVAHGSL